MYYINGKSLEIEMKNGSSIHIGNDSKFYDYISRIIKVEQKTNKIAEKIIDNMNNYEIEDYIELLKDVSNIQEKSIALINDRASVYKNFKKVDNIDSDLETFKLQDEILVHEIESFENHIANTSLTIEKCKDILKALKNVEKNTKAFMKKVGEENSKIQNNENNTNNVTQKYGIPENSIFYSPIKNSLELGTLLEEAKQIAQSKQKENSKYANIESKLENLIELNNTSISEKHKHSDKYVTSGITFSDNLMDRDGNSYYKRIEPMTMKLLENAKSFLESSKKEEILNSEMELNNIENLIKRDLKFSSEIRLRDK